MKKSIFLFTVLFGCANILFAQKTSKVKLVPVAEQLAKPTMTEEQKKAMLDKRQEAKIKADAAHMEDQKLNGTKAKQNSSKVVTKVVKTAPHPETNL
jgi:hypothetical protein